MRRAKLRICAFSIFLVLLAAGCSMDLVEQAQSLYVRHGDSGIEAAKGAKEALRDPMPSEQYYVGRAVSAHILSRYALVADKSRTAYLNTLGQALVRYSDMPDTYRGYHFALIDSRQINAFAAPGGFVFLTTGLFASLESEEQLAAVVAHEIAHVTLEHGMGAISSANWAKVIGIIGKSAAEEYGGAMLGELTELFEDSIDDIVNKLVVNGYGKSQEFAADKEALSIVHRAGYNPAGLGEFLQTLREQSAGADKAGFFDTHPPARDRLKKVAGTDLKGTTDKARTDRFAKHSM